MSSVAMNRRIARETGNSSNFDTFNNNVNNEPLTISEVHPSNITVF